MLEELGLGGEFFERLEREDEAIARRVAEMGCPHCGGRLYRGDFDRKPRGALVAPAAEASVRRHSLCCGREGCRRRATPPSLRFLGRRLYVGAVVIAASMVALALQRAGAIRAATGVPARTTARWLAFWRGAFVRTEVFVATAARLVGVAVEALPTSIVDRLAGDKTERVERLLKMLAPITTSSVIDGSRFLRAGS
jgi:hypothetical protein